MQTKTKKLVRKCNFSFFRLLSELAEIMESENAPDRFKTLIPAEEYIHEHYLESDFFCGILPGICGCKSSYFNRLFLEKYNKSPLKYVTELRMEHASELLTNIKLSVEEVAKQTGYHNPNYFCTVFKNFFGIAPSYYGGFVKRQSAMPYLPYFDKNDKKLADMLTFSELLSDININKLSKPKDIEYNILPETCKFDQYTVTQHQGIFLIFGCLNGDLYMYKSGLEEPLRLTDDCCYSAPSCIRTEEILYILVSRYTEGIDLLKFNIDSQSAELIYRDTVPFIATGNSSPGENGVILIPGKTPGSSYKDVTVPAIMEFKENQRLELSIIDNHKLPDGTTLSSPDTTLCYYDNSNYAFIRNDKLNVNLMYIAKNYHDWWSTATYHNIPFTNTKICSGPLKDGRNYIVANLYPGINRLALFISEPNRFFFRKAFLIKESGKNKTDEFYNPSAVEIDSKLHIYYSSSDKTEVAVVNIESI